MVRRWLGNDESKHDFAEPTEETEGSLPTPLALEVIQPLLAHLIKGKRRTSSTYPTKRGGGA